MPIYEYVCPDCGPFEEMQKVSEPALTHCPRGHAGVERKISAAGFILKGSGWYITDYARKGSDGPGNGSKADKAADKGGEKAGAKPADKSAKGDSKPAAETKTAATGAGS